MDSFNKMINFSFLSACYLNFTLSVVDLRGGYLLSVDGPQTSCSAASSVQGGKVSVEAEDADPSQVPDAAGVAPGDGRQCQPPVAACRPSTLQRYTGVSSTKPLHPG